MFELYVYYQVRADQILELQAKVKAYQIQLTQAHVGLGARLLSRFESAPDNSLLTWMEIYSYAGGSEDFEKFRRFENQLAAQTLTPYLASIRHAEVFLEQR